MKIVLPRKENITATGAADPLKFYYLPVTRSFYISRFADAVRLLGGRVRRLLDVGCGSGIFLPELAKHCDSLLACDVHPHLDQIAEMLRAESVRASLIQSDARALPYATETLDAIVCMSVLEHLHDPDLTADEFFRVLSPGGIAVVGVPVTNLITEATLRMSYLSLDACLEDEHVSTHTDVINAFSGKFVMEDLLHIPRLLPEGLRLYSTVRLRKPSGNRGSL